MPKKGIQGVTSLFIRHGATINTDCPRPKHNDTVGSGDHPNRSGRPV